MIMGNEVPYDLKAVALSGGRQHSIALMENGKVVAWGNNEFGKCYVPRSVSLNRCPQNSLSIRTDINEPPPILVETATIGLQTLLCSVH